MNRVITSLATVIVAFTNVCWAMPANPAPFTVTQPNGQQAQLYLRGNEYRNYLQEATSGYIVVESQTVEGQSQYTYATTSAEGALASSGIPVGSIDLTQPAGAVLASSLLGEGSTLLKSPPSQSGWTGLGDEHQLRRRNGEQQHHGLNVRANAASTIKNLVIMVRYV